MLYHCVQEEGICGEWTKSGWAMGLKVRASQRRGEVVNQYGNAMRCDVMLGFPNVENFSGAGDHCAVPSLWGPGSDLQLWSLEL